MNLSDISEILAKVAEERGRAPHLAALLDRHAATISRVAKLADELRKDAENREKYYMGPQGEIAEVVQKMRSIADRIEKALEED